MAKKTAVRKNEKTAKQDAAAKLKAIIHSVPVQVVPIDSIDTDPDNANTHPRRNIEDIKSALLRFGQVEPLLTWGGKVKHGSGRLVAMRELEWEQVEIRDLTETMPEEAARALSIAMNRTAESSEWDFEVLAGQLREFEADNADLLNSLGFAPHELEPLLAAEWTPPNVDSEYTGDPGGDGEADDAGSRSPSTVEAIEFNASELGVIARVQARLQEQYPAESRYRDRKYCIVTVLKDWIAKGE